MDTDVLVKLGHAAANYAVLQIEKTAAPMPMAELGSLGMRAAKGLGSQVGRLFTKSAPGMASNAARKFAPMRTAATLGAGAAAGQGAYQAATGGWDDNTPGNLAWHKQTIGGANGAMPAIKGLLGSPAKSIASMFAGPGQDTLSTTKPRQGSWVPDPANPQNQIFKETAPESRTVTAYSPKIEGQFSQYQDAQNKLTSMQQGQDASIDNAKRNWLLNLPEKVEGMPAEIAQQRTAARNALSELQRQRQSGSYGGGWFGNNASHYDSLIKQLEPGLRDSGRLPPPTPPKPQPTAAAQDTSGIRPQPNEANSPVIGDWTHGASPLSIY